MAVPPGGAFLPSVRPAYFKDQTVTVLDAHWGSTDRTARNANLVKIIQIDVGAAQRWWLVYAYPFVVDAFANRTLHHRDLTIAGQLSTDTLVNEGYIPSAYDKNALHIPAAHVLVLYSENKSKSQPDWERCFGAPTNETLWTCWMQPVLKVGVKLVNLHETILKRPSPSVIRAHFGLHRENYVLWSRRCWEKDDDDDRYISDDCIDLRESNEEYAGTIELVSNAVFKRRQRAMRRAHRRATLRGGDVAASEAASDAFFRCMLAPRPHHCKYLHSTCDPCTRYPSIHEDPIQRSVTLLKHLALAADK
jgi:hypothetical protein